MTYRGWNIQHRAGDFVATKGPQRLACATLQQLKDLMDASRSPRVCAWCRTVMGKTDDDCGGTSHGICDACYARESAAAGLDPEPS